MGKRHREPFAVSARLCRGGRYYRARFSDRPTNRNQAAAENRLVRASELVGDVRWQTRNAEIAGNGGGTQADPPPRGRSREGSRAGDGGAFPGRRRVQAAQVGEGVGPQG